MAKYHTLVGVALSAAVHSLFLTSRGRWWCIVPQAWASVSSPVLQQLKCYHSQPLRQLCWGHFSHHHTWSFIPYFQSLPDLARSVLIFSGCGPLIWTTYCCLLILSFVLVRGSTDFFCKELGSKYFRLWGHMASIVTIQLCCGVKVA